MKTKKYFKSAALVIFVFFVSWSPLDKLIARSTPAASAQEVDLVDLKKKEEKRKKESKKSKYVVTNENIGNIKVPKKSYGFIKVETKDGKAKSLNDQLPSGEAGSPRDARAEGDTTSTGSAKDERAYWQELVRHLNIAIRDLETNINKSQTELNGLMLNWYAEDDLKKRKEKKMRLTELQKSIPELQKELAQRKKEMEALEARARKEGIPPGWLRVDDQDIKPPPQKKKDKEDKEGEG